jgi:hypothetical protein
MTKDEALTLQSATYEVLSVARAKRDEIDGAINWGDLACVDVSVSLLDDQVTVWIEEASPDATELHQFVSSALDKMGHSAICVVTEW